MKDPLKEKLLDIIAEATDNPVVSEELQYDEQLFGTGRFGFDSIDMVSVIVLVERIFDFNFPQDSDLKTQFCSINTIAEVVLKYCPDAYKKAA